MGQSKELVLGIETSCDDTSVALVNEKGLVIAEKTITQHNIHAAFGGVFPELASRAHLHALKPALIEVLEKSKIDGKKLLAIGVTRGPGLIGSLLTGINYAAGLSIGWNVPLYGINHLRGHIRSVDLEEQRLETPAIILLVSGGHTLLAYHKNKNEIELLGSTIDDSVGEVYDKVARMMGLGFPGGPIIDKLAKQGEAIIQFPRPLLKDAYRFSFSGLKSAVARYIDSTPQAKQEDICASFVEACLEVLFIKSCRALTAYKPKSFAIVGGVAASMQVREKAQHIAQKYNVNLCLPPLKWSTDNGAMIALATWDYIHNNWQQKHNVETRLHIQEM